MNTHKIITEVMASTGMSKAQLGRAVGIADDTIATMFGSTHSPHLRKTKTAISSFASESSSTMRESPIALQRTKKAATSRGMPSEAWS